MDYLNDPFYNDFDNISSSGSGSGTDYNFDENIVLDPPNRTYRHIESFDESMFSPGNPIVTPEKDLFSKSLDMNDIFSDDDLDSFFNDENEFSFGRKSRGKNKGKGIKSLRHKKHRKYFYGKKKQFKKSKGKDDEYESIYNNDDSISFQTIKN